jgi:hypothetical protein
LAQELGFVQVSPTIIFEDNNLLSLGVILKGVPNISIYGFFFLYISRGLVKGFFFHYISRGFVKFQRVDSKNQITDIGTSPRPWPVFQNHRPILYGEPITSSSTLPLRLSVSCLQKLTCIYC